MKTYTTCALLVAVLSCFAVRAWAAVELLPNLEALPQRHAPYHFEWQHLASFLDDLREQRDRPPNWWRQKP